MMITYSSGSNSLFNKFLRLLLALALLPTILHAQAPETQQSAQPAAGGLAPTGQKFRVVRSMAGTSGRQVGDKLVIDNPQTIFHLNQDHKVIVYFEWEGPIGPHKFEGLWKNPEGNVVMVSDFAYTAAGTQFAGYWTMLLSGSETVGIWTLQARIDGEDAGSYPFQLVTEPGAPSPAPTAPVRQPLSPDALYQRALSAIVFVDKYDAAGKMVLRGSGFYLDDGRVVTAFHNIDGAKFVRLTLADGRVAQLTQALVLEPLAGLGDTAVGSSRGSGTYAVAINDLTGRFHRLLLGVLNGGRPRHRRCGCRRGHEISARGPAFQHRLESN